MRAAHERRVDGAVPYGSLGIGEMVEVRTRMGELVGSGDVYAATPFGVTLREGGTEHRFYHGDYFLFLPIPQVLPEEPTNLLADAHPDARVRAPAAPGLGYDIDRKALEISAVAKL